MDIAKLLAVHTHDHYDVTSLKEENDRIRRLLAATARSYNALKKELDSAREELGHNKSPIPFLEFPREVRDQIYLYALRAAYVNTEPRPIEWLAFEYCGQMKPTTPSLCLANKQVYEETVEVLYSKNTFRFDLPGHLLQFENQIGGSNRDLVRRIEIVTTRHLPGNSFMADPELVAPCDYQAIPTHWAKALSTSKLRWISEMVVVNYPSLSRDVPIDVPACLTKAVEGIFARNKDESLVPRLTLEGFGEKEWNKFPQHWEVKMVRAVLGPQDVLGSGAFASSVLAFDHGNFGYLPGQDEDGDSDRSEQWDIPPWKRADHFGILDST
jgi:hypothetical protein